MDYFNHQWPQWKSLGSHCAFFANAKGCVPKSGFFIRRGFIFYFVTTTFLSQRGGEEGGDTLFGCKTIPPQKGTFSVFLTATQNNMKHRPLPPTGKHPSPQAQIRSRKSTNARSTTNLIKQNNRTEIIKGKRYA